MRCLVREGSVRPLFVRAFVHDFTGEGNLMLDVPSSSSVRYTDRTLAVFNGSRRLSYSVRKNNFRVKCLLKVNFHLILL